MNLNLDFETRSECDLLVAGAYVYARHPSTRVLCAAYSIDGGPVQIWPTAAGHPMPNDLDAALRDPGCTIHAWNSQFERLILCHTLKLPIPIARFRCTAAWARARGLPGKLEGALNFLQGDKGDKAARLAAKRKGSAIMKKWCKPLPLGGWANDPDEYMALLRYCMDDVESEQWVASVIAADPMRQDELDDFNTNELINDQGLPIDRDLAIAAQSYGEEERAELNEELQALTEGRVTSNSQHARIKAWLVDSLGQELFDKHFRRGDKATTDKAARADFLLSEDAKEYPEVADFVELVDDAGKASVAKYAKMAARAADSGRAEGSYLYAGAGQTKRYSSQGIQVHNMPRTVPQDVPGAVASVLEHRIEGKVMHVLSSLLRPTIMAVEGRQIIWGDWSSVEARGMPWLADCQWKLDLYRQQVDVYKRNAVDIFGVALGDVTDHQRQVGKVSELSLQFGGAKGALRAMARGYGIGFKEGEAEAVVDGWRSANKWAAKFSQGLLQAFCGALLFRGMTVHHGPVAYTASENHPLTGVTMRCELPGGTVLYYQRVDGDVWLRAGKDYHRAVAIAGMPSGRMDSATVLRAYAEYHGATWARNAGFVLAVPPWVVPPENIHTPDSKMNPRLLYTKAMTSAGKIERVWHGLLAENVTQALCAALLRDCLRRVAAALKRAKLDAFVIGHTHDEIILEAARRHVERAKKILLAEMVRVPEWLPGFPLGAEIKSGQRYGK